MFKTVASIKKPTIISAGAVANAGIARNTGANSKEAKKSIATVTAVRPVRPPAITPEELSTKVVTVDVPSTAPADVATESASSAPLILAGGPVCRAYWLWKQHRLKYQCVKQIYKHKRQHYGNKIKGENIAEIHLHKARHQARYI